MLKRHTNIKEWISHLNVIKKAFTHATSSREKIAVIRLTSLSVNNINRGILCVFSTLKKKKTLCKLYIVYILKLFGFTSHKLLQHA